MAASFSFGSFGDIITLCQLAKAGVDALDDSRGSAASYQSLRSALSNLTYVLFKIKALTETGKIADLDVLTHTLEDCFTCLRDFSDKIQKYGKSLGARNGSGNWLKDSYRKVKWTGMKEDVAAFHDNVGMYLAMLQLLLQSAGFDTQAQDKQQLYERLEEADTMENARFQDTNQRLQTGFSTQRVLLGQIIDRVEALGTTGISNEQRKVAEDIRSLERRATGSVFSAASSGNVQESYEAAIASSRLEVGSLIRLHRRSNSRFVDPHFDLAKGCDNGDRFCIGNLAGDGSDLRPGSHMQLEQICDDARFLVHGFDSADVDSPVSDLDWLSPALAVLSSVSGLLENVCHSRDEALGIYGFAFYRDGEWTSHVVDATLYLEKPLWSSSLVDQFTLKLIRRGIERKPDTAYRKTYLTGTQALYFSASYDTSETWPSLMEKAYAKAHGDYGSLCGMSIADALEDFTGGVTVELRTSEILDHDRLWAELLSMQSGVFIGVMPRNELAYEQAKAKAKELNLVSRHKAASVLKVREIEGHKLVFVRDPDWLRWDGAWSDGSKEWTPDFLMRLEHKFGDEGKYWISYKDFLAAFPFILMHQTFDSNWTVAQQWYTFEVPLTLSRTEEYFKVTVQPQVDEDHISSDNERGPDNDRVELTIVLSQLDTTYFRGLEGRYHFELQFDVENQDGDLIARTRQRTLSKRSAAVRLLTEPSSGYHCYYVRPRVVATKMPESHSIEKMISRSIEQRRDKLLQAALSYDVAHAKVPGWGNKCEKVRQRQEGRRRGAASSSVALSGGVDAPVPYSIRDDTTLVDEAWDALCCMGLRVYAKCAETTIEIQKDGVDGESDGNRPRVETLQGEPAPKSSSEGAET